MARLRNAAASVANMHAGIFHAVERWTDGWLLGFLARFLFAGVLLVYYLNAASLKVGDGLFGFFQLSPGAYIQILGLPALDAAGGDPTVLSFVQKLIVFAGTYAEFVLPVLIVVGLFSRLAALGMIGFIAVQSYVDVTLHGLDERSVGVLFDRFPDAIIADQRMLWLFPLAYVVLRGPGLISLDAALGRFVKHQSEPDRGVLLHPAE